MKKSEVLQQRKELIKLIEQWTRAEIMARYSRFDNLEFADYARIEIEKKNEIRKFLFGEFELFQLAEKWGLVKTKGRKKKSNKRYKVAKAGNNGVTEPTWPTEEGSAVVND